MRLTLKIGYLYSDLMNIYGDTGNIITLQKRAEWRGIKVKVVQIPLGYKLEPGEIDLFFFGGGQDQSQTIVAKDLKNKAKILKAEIERGVPLLSICGGYQLLGEYYQPFEGPKLEGVGVFPAYTKASYDRMIGNLVIQMKSDQIGKSVVQRVRTSTPTHRYSDLSDLSETLVGFENHSGKTYLKEGATPLGKVIKGFGNNGEDQTEGCIYKNAIGCYMHGSLLPKNPVLADWLIQKALEIKYGKEITLEPLVDEFENEAHEAAIKKFG